MGNFLFKKPNEENEGNGCVDNNKDTRKQREQYAMMMTEMPTVMNSLSYKPITLVIQHPPITNSFFYLINGTRLYVVADNDKQCVHFIQYSNDHQQNNDAVPTKQITLSMEEWFILQSSKVRNISWYIKNDQYSNKLLPILTKPNCSIENLGNTALFFAKDDKTNQVYACLSKINEDDNDFDLKETMVITLSSWFGILDCVQLLNEKMGIIAKEEGNINIRKSSVLDISTSSNKKAKADDPPIVSSQVKTFKKQKRKQSRQSTRK